LPGSECRWAAPEIHAEDLPGDSNPQAHSSYTAEDRVQFMPSHAYLM
jgi:hypothetical protein